MPDVLFDEAAHTYKVGNTFFPSVTTVLRDLSPMRHVDPSILAAASERGKDVHLACELHDRETLDLSSVSREIMPYLRAWARFTTEWTFKPSMIEGLVYSMRWGYAGTLDRFGQWTRNGRRREILLDIKSGVKDPTHGPQTAAYLQAMREVLPDANGSFLPDRATVYLHPDGTYSVEIHNSPGDWPLFHAALLVHQFKTKANP